MENFYDYLNINQELFYSILYSGNINYIKLFVKYTEHEIDLKLINEDDYFILFSYNNIELLDYLLTLKRINLDNNISILNLTINLNKYKITEWLLKKFKFDNLHSNNDYCYVNCLIYKNLELLSLLYVYDNEFNDYKLEYLKISSKIDDLSIFIWISSKFNDLDYTFNNNELIINALENDNISILKYILNKIDNFDINFDDGIILRTAFKNNYYEIIYFLFEKYSNLNVLVQNEIIMKYAIEDGDLDILNLLYTYNNQFNLSINNEHLFKTATKMNNIYIVKWLLEKKKNINYQVNNNELFYYICENNYYEMALFFVSLNKNLYQINLNSNNEIISYLVNKNLIINELTKIEISKENIEKCPICLDKNCILITNCNHQYCYNCLDLLNKKNIELKCVYCRNKIDEIKYLKY